MCSTVAIRPSGFRAWTSINEIVFGFDCFDPATT